MDDLEKNKIIQEYSSYSDEALFDALLLPEADYAEGVYAVLLEHCQQRGMKNLLSRIRYEKKVRNALLNEQKQAAVGETGESLVTVARFTQVYEAYLAKTRLASEGVECFMLDENIVSLNWFYSNAVGGAKIQVKTSDRDKAIKILTAIEKNKQESKKLSKGKRKAKGKCPNCQSSNIYRETISKKGMVFWQLTGIPLPFLKRRTKCYDCGAEW